MHGPHHVAQKSNTTTLPFIPRSGPPPVFIQFSTESAGGALPCSGSTSARRAASPPNQSAGISAGVSASRAKGISGSAGV